jgi:hypothetical protein
MENLVDKTLLDIANQGKPAPQGEPTDNLNNPANAAEGAQQEESQVEEKPIVEPNGLESVEDSNPVNPDASETEEDLGDDDLVNWWESSDTTDETPPSVENAENPVVENTSPDYSELAKELGLEAGTKQEILDQYSKLREDALAAQEYKDLPYELAQAIEMAKKGQDYTSLFERSSDIDHSKFDDRTLLMNENARYFQDPEGNIDTDALAEYVDDMTEVQQKIEARKVRENIDNFNLTQREKRVQENQRRAQAAQSELQTTINQTEEIKGYKVRPEDKAQAIKDITSGQAMKEMFYKEDGKTYDMGKIFEIYFLKKNFDSITSFLKNKSANQAKANDFKSISNAKDSSRSVLPNVESPKPRSGDDLADLLLNELKSKAGINVQ